MRIHTPEKIIYSLAGLILISGIIAALVYHRKPALPTNVSGEQAKQKLPKVVVNVNPGQIITSPLKVQGKAVGSWFFEAQFPIILLDGNGKVLAQTTAEAQGDWQTEDYVPFTANLYFNATSAWAGSLVFVKDNPSGMPENSAEVTVPVTFK